MFGKLGVFDFSRMGASARPFWSFPFKGAYIDMNFTNGQYFGSSTGAMSITRASLGTDLLPTSPGATTFTSFATGTARISPGVGLIIEESRTNSATNSTAPVTQTTTVAIGTWVLWCNSTGAGTVVATSGTAVGSGYGTASQGTANTITITTSGTIILTVNGTVTAMQLEKMPGTVAAPTSLIQTSAAAATRAADIVNITSLTAPTTEFTIYGSGIPGVPAAFATNQALTAISDGTANNRVTIFRNSASGNMSITSLAAGTASQITGTSATSSVAIKIAGSVLPGGAGGVGVVGALNGVGISKTSSTGIGAGETILELGNRGDNTLPWDGVINRVALWGFGMSTGNLDKLTLGPQP